MTRNPTWISRNSVMKCLEMADMSDLAELWEQQLQNPKMRAMMEITTT